MSTWLRSHKEVVALGFRIGVALLVGAPFAMLAGWILGGEAHPSTIKNADLRAFYESTYSADWVSLNLIRAVLFLMLSVGLTAYIFRVRTLMWSITTGVCLLAAVALYFWGLTRYKTAETRLALHPYLAEVGPSTLEDVSLLMGPLFVAMAAIFVLGAFFDSIARDVAELDAIAPLEATSASGDADDPTPHPEGIRG